MQWLKQTAEAPLYPDLEWEKPERKDQAGKLLIIGGNLQGFASVAKADQIAREQGIGYVRMMLPDALRKTLAPLWTDALFCPSTSTGSFSKDSRDMFLQNALWADGILITGDLGRNSETAILLDELVQSTRSPLAITKDALDYYLERPKTIFERSDTLIVGSFSQLQRLMASAKYPDPLVYTMPLASLVGTMQRFTTEHPCTIITKTDNHIIVAQNGAVISTRLSNDTEIWRLEIATKSIVATLHHPLKVLEGIASVCLG
jgi:NAD(P)H-hydrate repair Nnr-like enzyme with NAD(P)H-hydrate dehydratase domain